MVVEERENIIPGFVQSLTAELKAGQYQMTCGLLTKSERRALPSRLRQRARQRASRAPLESGWRRSPNIKVYVAKEVGDLVEQTKALRRSRKGRKVGRGAEIYMRQRVSTSEAHRAGCRTLQRSRQEHGCARR